MGANPTSYAAAQLAAVFGVDVQRDDLAVRVDGPDGPIRFRLSVDDARELSVRIGEEIAAYESRRDQSPISSGMPSSDGSPMEGQSI